MSPSEAQLRAALRDGEGEQLDANSLISHALYVRREQRRRVNAVVGIAAAVLVVGGGTAALTTRGDRSNNSSSATSADAAGGNAHVYSSRKATAAASAARPAAGLHSFEASSSAAASRSGNNSAAAVAAQLRCPAAADRFALPGGGGTRQFGSTGPLFTGAVNAIKVCVYGGRAPAAAVVSGADASAIVNTLESAGSVRSPSETCPSRPVSSEFDIELLGVNSAGAASQPVVITGGCLPYRATNGTALRFIHALPAALATAVKASTSADQPPASPSR